METKKETPLEKELKELKLKHAKVRSFIIPLDEDDDEKVLTLFLKPCDRKCENMVNKLAKTSPENAVIAGLNYLKLGGDNVEDLKNNDYAIRAAEGGLVQYMKPAEVIIKKN